MTVYIVGTDHDMQHDAPSRRAAPDKVQRARREFQAYLYTLVDRLKLQVIAEEFSQQALDGYNAESTVRPVADKLGIEHRFCDPGATERVELGLPHPFLDHCEEREKPQLNRIRESYWLDRLSDVLHRDILFICGAEHVHSFCELVRSKGIDAAVEMEHFGKKIYGS